MININVPAKRGLRLAIFKPRKNGEQLKHSYIVSFISMSDSGKGTNHILCKFVVVIAFCFDTLYMNI